MSVAVDEIARIILSRKDELNISYQEIADRCGMKRSTIQRYARGGIKNIPISRLRALASALEISEYKMLGWDQEPDGRLGKTRPTEGGDMPLSWAAPLAHAYAATSRPKQDAVCAVLDIGYVVPDGYAPEHRRISKIVYNDKAAAGDPLCAESDYERIQFYEDEIPAGADFGVRISGQSMEPTIDDGCIVWVHQQEDIMHGQIGIFNVNSGALCKRYYSKNGIVKLTSDNPDFGDIQGDALEGLRCVGRVLQ